MSQKMQFIISVVVTAVIVGSSVYLWQVSKSPAPTLPADTITNQKQTNQKKSASTAQSNEWEGLIKYNCEFSGGSFTNGTCKCLLEKDISQTQEDMYDKNTGYCQTTHGGPGGDAFASSVGLPWGDFSFWNHIVENNCTDTGGNWGTARCNCTDEKIYNKFNGYCE